MFQREYTLTKLTRRREKWKPQFDAGAGAGSGAGNRAGAGSGERTTEPRQVPGGPGGRMAQENIASFIQRLSGASIVEAGAGKVTCLNDNSYYDYFSTSVRRNKYG